jgi:hypothetical protein
MGFESLARDTKKSHLSTMTSIFDLLECLAQTRSSSRRSAEDSRFSPPNSSTNIEMQYTPPVYVDLVAERRLLNVNLAHLLDATHCNQRNQPIFGKIYDLDQTCHG